ncbi:VWA domain-containing protein [Oceanidesulfovibrio marinus]|uniref:VWA domain-containing protein n=2 Tax=Oceanidesulfovibrio marinus TaxID=370038 RepID=A0ABX6NJ75_9BACT|nr:VWA domain-containing protein [Oceanidesulfovibrio marinus]
MSRIHPPRHASKARRTAMRRKTLLLIILFVVCFTAALAFGPGATASGSSAVNTPDASFTEGPLELGASLTRSKVAVGSDGRFSLALTFFAPDTYPDDRPAPVEKPVDLVVVLDRSGSMRGAKITDARNALALLVDTLSPRDRLGLVSYADGVQVHTPPIQVTAGNRSLLQQAVMRIVAGGNTNLGSGLRTGLEQLRQVAMLDDDAPISFDDCRGCPPHPSGRTRRVILISDGLANRGVTDPGALAGMARRAAMQGWSVSAVGVGLDFNEYLMTCLADAGGGTYHFLEEPQAFADLFMEELHAARRIAATSMSIDIRLPRGVSLEEASGYEITRSGDGASLLVGDITAGSSRTIHLTLRADTRKAAEYVLDSLAVSYMQENATMNQTLASPLRIAAVADESEAEASYAPAAWERKVLREDYGKLKETVARAVSDGDKDEAMEAIKNYRQKTAQQNQAVGSDKVQENLDSEVSELESSVEESFSGSATEQMAKQKEAGKRIQYEGYMDRRDKSAARD